MQQTQVPVTIEVALDCQTKQKVEETQVMCLFVSKGMPGIPSNDVHGGFTISSIKNWMILNAVSCRTYIRIF